MTRANRMLNRMSTTAFTLAVIAAFSPYVKAQEPPQVHVGGATITGLPSDWSHHHVIYGNPGTEQDAIKNGTHEQWLKVVNDPRYIVQNLKRGLPVQGPAAQDVEMRYRIADQERRSRDGRQGRNHQHSKPEPTLTTMHRDWSMSTGGSSATITLTAVTPSAGNPASGTSTLVLSAGGPATMTASAPTAETGTLTFTTPANTATLVLGGVTYTFSNGATLATPGTANNCNVSIASGGTTTPENNLLGAMTNGTDGAGTAGNATWRCNATMTGQIFSVTSFVNVGGGTHTITIGATIAGMTGIGTVTLPAGITWNAGSPVLGTDGTADATHFTYWNGNAFDTAAQFALALAAAVNASADNGNVTATTSGASLIITANAIGTGGNAYTTTSNFTHLTPASGTLSGGVAPGSLPDVFPAKFSLSTAGAVNCSNASQPDYIVYPTGVAGSASNATVIAYDNMYASSCTGTVPKVYWAYNTGTGNVVTSPIISYDGTQVAVIESAAGGAVLRIVKFNAGDGTDRNSPFAFTPATNSFANTNSTNAGNTAWTGCPAGSCMISVAFQAGAANPDTNSSPFYDFDDDILYVGDDNGKLHKFTGVFRGTPGEVITGGWPITFTVAATKLTSPVVDPITGNLYVGSANGRLYQVTTPNGTPGIANYSAALAAGTGIVDSPVVDTTPFPSASVVYAFVGDSTQSATQSAVFQFSSTFSGAGTNNWLHTIAMGTNTGSTTLTVYDGDFDNTHYGTTGGTSGNLYFCGGTSGTATSPQLFRIPITGAGFGTVVATDGLATAATCSPATEFNNTGSGGSALTTLTSTATLATTTVAIAGIGGTGATATFTVNNTTGIAIGDYVKIDTEDMLVTGVTGTFFGTLTVTRPVLGTTEATHSTGATVTAFTGMTAATTSITVASGASIQNGDYIQVGSEFMNVTAGGGTTGLTVTRGVLGTTAAIQAPDSNILIPALDWLFVGVTANGGDTACNSTTGCLYSFYIGTALGAGSAATDGLPAAGGTSGIVIDNGFTADGASQVYYTTLSSQVCTGDSSASKGVGSGSCAIQASQSGLQ